MSDSEKEIKAWREVGVGKRFLNAFRGMHVFLEISRHLSILVFTVLAILILGIFFKISSFEWIALVFAIGFVVVSEVFNTAIEIDINLTSPEFHPFARDTKDVAAAAVLLSIFTAVIIGLIVFLPKFFYANI